VVSRFDPVWAREFHEHVLLLVRDIANPSPQDPYFNTFRHKDWCEMLLLLLLLLLLT